MQNAMREVNERNRAAGLPAVEIGVGIETGEVVVGNIGSVRRAKYGVVGAPVNMAARIEAYTVGGQVMISESTLRDLAGRARTGTPIQVEPKGCKEPVSLYEVSALEGRFNVALERRPEPPPMVAVEVPCSVVLYDDKFASGEPHAARIVKASMAQLDIECDAKLPRLANVRLTVQVAAGEPAVDSLYAKVGLAGEECLTSYRLTLTSTPPSARRYLERLIRPARPGQRHATATAGAAHA
jgi:adenylate cyclase